MSDSNFHSLFLTPCDLEFLMISSSWLPSFSSIKRFFHTLTNKFHLSGINLYKKLIHFCTNTGINKNADKRCNPQSHQPFLLWSKRGTAQQGIDAQRRECLQRKNTFARLLYHFTFCFSSI